MKVVGYLRVSTDGQAEKGLGLAVQEEAIRQWARRHGHGVVEVYQDAKSGKAEALDDRLGLADALVALQSGAAQGIVVYRLDRLARDLVLQETLLAEVWQRGSLFSTFDSEQANLTDDPNDPSRTMIRQILGAVGQYERSMIAMRLRNGRLRKARDGGYAGGAPPLGKRAEDGRLVTDASERQTVLRIVRERRAGRSLREIGAALERDGIRTKRGGTTWSPVTVSRVLEREGVR